MRILGMLLFLLALIGAVGCTDDCTVCPEVDPPVGDDPSGGRAWLVPQDFLTISEALAAAEAGDTVCLAGGTYEEYDLTLPSGLVLMGSGSPDDPVVLDGRGQGRLLNCSAGDSLTVLSGLTLTGGYLSELPIRDGAALHIFAGRLRIVNCTFVGNETTIGNGGGIAAFNSDLELENCRFEGNSSVLFGGGIFADFLSAVRLDHCFFTENFSGEAGGALAANCRVEARGSVFEHNDNRAVLADDQSHITQCTFRENNGGALRLSSDGLVENCLFSDNVIIGSGAGLFGGNGLEVVGSIFLRNLAIARDGRQDGGGGLYVYGDSLEVMNCDFIENQADDQGGAVSFHNAAIIRNSRFVGNQSRVGAGLFGGSGLELFDCDLLGNRGDYAAAIRCQDASLQGCTLIGNISRFWTIHTYSASELRQCTLAANVVDPNESILYFGYLDEAAEISSCILAFNTGVPFEEDSTVPVLDYCDIYGNSGGDWVGIIQAQEGTEGNFSLDPLFCDMSVGNVFLCNDSPCLPPGTGHDEVVGARESGCVSCGN